MDNHENMSDGKTWLLIGLVVAILVAIAVGISVAANVASGVVEHQRSDAHMVETVERIQPVGKTNLASSPNPDLGKVVVAAAVAAEPKSGKEVYGSACIACHAAGVLGAPKYGDAVWKSLVSSKGLETLYDHAINGVGNMPARGGNPALSDEEMKAAVDYMIEAAK